MDYQKTWEVMQGLEDSFNRITVIETLTNDLEVASNNNDFEEVKVLIKALSHYLPTFISHYDKASKKAWNNTVKNFKFLTHFKFTKQNNNIIACEFQYFPNSILSVCVS